MSDLEPGRNSLYWWLRFLSSQRNLKKSDKSSKLIAVKIWTYCSSRSSKIIDLDSNQKCLIASCSNDCATEKLYNTITREQFWQYSLLLLTKSELLWLTFYLCHLLFRLFLHDLLVPLDLRHERHLLRLWSSQQLHHTLNGDQTPYYVSITDCTTSNWL